jgi:two-component system, cell cycle sensor histidine kinase and response regulator CckA
VSSDVGSERSARRLADLGVALSRASTDLTAVVEIAAETAATVVGNGAVIRLVGEDGLLDHSTFYHADATKAALLGQLIELQPVRADEGTSAVVAATRRPHVLNTVDISELLPAFRAVLRQLDLRALLTVPLVADDRYLGMLSICRFGVDTAFDDADVDLASDIAVRVSLAVANAQALAALRWSEQRYREIVETSLEGVWRRDLAGVTTFVNGRMGEILGVTPEDMIGRPSTEWIAPEDQAHVAVRLADRRAGRSEVYEVQLRRGDGSLVWVQISACPVRDERGAVIGALGMVSDISDRVRSRELQRRLDQLQRLDSLGQLAGGIAHDFNNLLSIIGGFTELIRSDVPTGSPVADLAAQVAATVDKGAGLTRQLLAFGRGQTGTPKVLDVHAVVADLAPLLERTLGEHVSLHLPARSEVACTVLIDRGQLEQVIVNLAANARDAMQGGGRLTIECDRVAADRAELDPTVMPDPRRDADRAPCATFVRLSVSDTGIGMDPAAQSHAFEPFFTTKPPGQGTGLGLAGVYGIVRGAGGVVTLYSELGHGTTVKVYLPLAATRVTEAACGRASTSPGLAGRDGVHVLVVEDSPDLAEVVRRLLTRAGCQVTVTHDGARALAVVDGGEPVDLVITDVVMPGLTGPEMVQQLYERRPDLPVIYTSGYTAGMLGHRDHVDADAILVEKPFTNDRLLDAVDEVLARRDS